MADKKDHPELQSESAWQVQTQVIRADPGLVQHTGGSDCLVVIYTREGRGPLGKRIQLDGPGLELTIGRDVQNSLVLEFEGVSRKHARLVKRDGAWWVHDNNSTNGTYVNDTLTRETPLRNGDRVKVGDVFLKFLSAGGIGKPTRHPRWHGSAPVTERDSGLAERHRGRVTADDEASGASPRRSRTKLRSLRDVVSPERLWGN